MTQSKRKIKAKEIVQDILNGVTDSHLMEKYNLGPKQLELLLQKMVNRGYLTQEQLDARITLEDTAVTQAFIDVQQSIRELDDMEVAGIIAQAQPKLPSKTRKVPTQSLVNDIRSGVNDSQLMDKYELASNQLEYMLENLLDSGQVTKKDLKNRLSLSDTSITKAFMDVKSSMEELDEID